MPVPSRLRARSDASLLSNLDTLVRNERRRVVEILHHLGEVDRRRLYANLGYSSLFDYCVTRLRYSESAAGRRVLAARALRRFPEIAVMLATGEASVMSIAMVARLLTPANHREILDGIRGKSKRDVEALVSGHRPEAVLRDRVRRISVKVPARQPMCGTDPAVPRETRRGDSIASVARPCTRTGGGDPAAVGLRDTPGNAVSHPIVETGVGPCARSATDSSITGEPAQPPAAMTTIQKTLMQFAADDAFMRKFEQVRALLSHRMPGATLEQVFDAALEAFLQANCPKRREARRRARGKTRAKREREEQGKKRRGGPPHNCRAIGAESAEPPATRGGALPPVGVKNDPEPRKRYIPAATRDHVFMRDGGRCTFVSPSRKRCNATNFLQVDHIVPFARGGGPSLSNLRLLCGQHNRLMAKRVMGHKVMGRHLRE